MIPYLLIVVHFAPAVYAVYHILLYKRDPRSAIGWIMICLFVPFGGALAYYLFGINRVRSRAKGLRQRFLDVKYEGGQQNSITEKTSDGGIRSLGYRITGKQLSNGNAVTPLFNGEEAYAAMLKAIDFSQTQVLLSTYILKKDSVGLSFAKSLCEAQKKGVDVRVLIDGVGELYSLRKILPILRQFNVSTARFLPPSLWPPSIYINLRNHRKLLVVDNEIAFAGGMNISADHLLNGTHKHKVSDVHFMFRGAVVGELSNFFLRDWAFATNNSVTYSNYTSDKDFGAAACRVISDGPDNEMDAIALTVQTAISSAQYSVDIMTPYFLPSRELIAAIQSAAFKGIKVRIVLPIRNNLFYMNWANRNTLAELVKWDVEVFYQPAPFCHSKLLCIDSEYSLIGSANLDPRSLRLNYEIGIEVFSSELNKVLKTHFNRIIADSRQLQNEDLENRSVPARLRDSAIALFSPYL